MSTVQPIVRNFSSSTVIVSRVQRFYDYPFKIFPVSCCNVTVQDTYFNDDLDENGEPLVNFYESIAGSRYFTSKVLKANAGTLVDLSAIRPKGTPGSNGMTSAGVRNFMAGYSNCNSEIRRGSAFRNGAVVLHLEASHLDLEEFLNCPNSEIPWCKRCVTVNPGWMDAPYYPLLEAAIADGRIFLNKQQYNSRGEKLKVNVCIGIQFLSRSTCTLAHVNLGLMQSAKDIPEAYLNGAKDLDVIWNDFYSAWSGGMGEQMARSANHFIDPLSDKQVGLGTLGLGNMLANFGVSYVDFTNALDAITTQQEMEADYFNIDEPSFASLNKKALEIAQAIVKGMEKAADYFRSKGYERAFTIEPCATCAFQQKDINGFTTSPEISPPIAHPVTKVTRRTTEGGFKDYQYPENIEIAGQVPWQVYDKLCFAWQRIMDNTGLAQSISYNWWLSKPVNQETLEDWDKSNLKGIYYRWQELSSDGDKTNIGMEVDKEGEEFWSIADEDDDVEEQAVICQLSSPGCASCGE